MKKTLTMSAMLSSLMFANEANQKWDGKYFTITFNQNGAKVDNKSNINKGNYYTGDDAVLISPHVNKDVYKNLSGATVSLGYNTQKENLIYGLELDLSLADYKYEYDSGRIEYHTLPGTFFKVQTKTKHDWILSLQPKIGYASNSIMYYITAGPSLAKIEYDFRKTDTAFNINFHQSSNKYVVGWNAGLGIEHKLGDNWSMRAEYLYTNFPAAAKENGTLSGYTTTYNNKVDYQINTFSIGLVKKF